MKRILSIVTAIAAVVTITVGVTACDLTAEKKAEIKSALAQAGSIAYSTAGRAKLESFLSEQVTAGKLTETQKAEALAAADKGVDALTAYLESASATSPATTTSAAASASPGTTAGTAAAASATTQNDQVK